jgi:hypothetical protein
MSHLDNLQLSYLIENNDEASLKKHSGSVRRQIKQHQMLLLKKALSVPQTNAGMLDIIYDNSAYTHEELPDIMLNALTSFPLSNSKIPWFLRKVPQFKYKDEWDKIIKTQSLEFIQGLFANYYPFSVHTDTDTDMNIQFDKDKLESFYHNLYHIGRFAVVNKKIEMLQWVMSSQQDSPNNIDYVFCYIFLASHPLNAQLLAQVTQHNIQWTNQFQNWINEDKLSFQFGNMFISQSQRINFKNMMKIVLKEHLENSIEQNHLDNEEDNSPTFKI